MRRIKFFAVFVLVFVSFVAVKGCFARDDSLPNQPSKLRFDRDIVIKKYFDKKDLASIEGIWVWETRVDKYEGAIISLDRLPTAGVKSIRKNYGRGIQYACFLTKAAEGLKPGALKMVIKEPIGGIYKGYYISYQEDWYGFEDSDELPIRLSIVSRNTLAMEATDREGNRVTNEAKRIYPISGSGSNNSHNIGIGFFVAKDVIATCYSNIAGFGEIRVHLKNGLLKGRLLVRDKTNDLALVKLEKMGTLTIYGTPLPIGDVGTLSKGDKVFVPVYSYLVGSPESKLKVGEILSLTGEKKDPRVFETNIQVDKVNNGAPLLNDSMQVVGILTYLPHNNYFKVNTLIPEGISYGIKINNIFNLAAATRECPRLNIRSPNLRINKTTVFDSIVIIEGLVNPHKKKSLYEIMKE
ncbi:serine protease [Thermovirga sp.]|uniref:S1 family peptidase n=1 Tax=Thermovirga sp. TaxID=2699834 RepID=UPI0025F13B9B|nr:serine protease [Thermovirga sp.]MBO8154713.1 trypsin-like peptidase domain-containing protein [Thermovirga sp.]